MTQPHKKTTTTTNTTTFMAEIQAQTMPSNVPPCSSPVCEKKNGAVGHQTFKDYCDEQRLLADGVRHGQV